MARKRVYRDYRKGNEGKFASEETYNRSQGQGVDCHIHKEFVEVSDESTITNIDELFEYDDYDYDDFDEYEFHATADTGKAKK
jgi:hypothetical protein